MITKQVGQAMATQVSRYNEEREQKLVVFYKALEIIQATEWKSGESQIIFAGTLGGKKAEIFLLNVGGRISLNLTVEKKTFEPLRMTETVNENDYLAWNLKIRKEMMPPQETQEQSQPAPASRPNKISKPKAVSQKAKSHDVTPLDHDTFRVRSGESGQEYFVRLLPNEQGGTCDCAWGQRRRYIENYKSGCSHVQAVYFQLEQQRGRTVSAWGTKEDALRQHRQMANIGDGVILTLRKN